jgi:hypothetical protein
VASRVVLSSIELVIFLKSIYQEFYTPGERETFGYLDKKNISYVFVEQNLRLKGKNLSKAETCSMRANCTFAVRIIGITMLFMLYNV